MPVATPEPPPAVAIVGGGPVGMALALALQRNGVRATVCDARRRAAAAEDPRVLALSHGSRLTLEALGVWHGLPATAIETIHVSQRGGFGRTRLVAADYGVDALGYVVGAGDLAAGLDRALAAAGVEFRDSAKAISAHVTDAAASLEFEHGASLDAQLIAWAEGSIADPGATVRDYGQHATICSATTVEAQRGTAYERFTDQGPLAVLPQGQGWSIVFTTSAAAARQLAALDDGAFVRRLQDQFGGRLHFTTVGPRTAYPLLLRVRREPTGPRQVWLGNAAQTLHPVAGQGFNLALRDLFELARNIARAADTGGDCGGPAVLAAYQRARRLDRLGVIGFTDGLVRLFSNDLAPLRVARGLGLLGLDLLPPLRGFVAKRMMFGARAWP